MKQYAILRFEKHKAGPAGALEAHHERKKGKYASNPDIDTTRSRDNYHFVRPSRTYRQEIDSRIKAAGCRTRKDSTMFVDTLVTASPEFFEGRKKSDVQSFFKEALAFMERKIGKNNIFSAVVHMDEKTPHLHLCFTPITKDGRLSAKDVLGNRAQLSKWQDEFHAHMKKAFPVLKRGESALVTKRKHIPMWLFKQSESLAKQQAAIEEILADINPINAGKKRNEALEMLGRFVPNAEIYAGNLKKYDATLKYLTQENASLKKEVNNRKGSALKQLDIGRLENENKNLQQFISNIPPDMMAELKSQQRQAPQKGR